MLTLLGLDAASIVNLDEALKVADKLTAPVILVFMAAVGWAMVKWFRPWVEKVFTAHLDLVNEMRACMASTIVEHRSQGDTLRKLAEAMQETREDMRETRQETAKIADAVMRIAEERRAS